MGVHAGLRPYLSPQPTTAPSAGHPTSCSPSSFPLTGKDSHPLEFPSVASTPAFRDTKVNCPVAALPPACVPAHPC